MASLVSVRALPILVGALDDERVSEAVIGRSDLVAHFWDAVRDSNLRVTGARHMGKTWALKLAAAQHPDWASPILIDAGACQTISEVVWRIAIGFGRIGIVPRDWAARVSQWHMKLASPDAGGTPAAPWLMVLNGTLQHASSHTGATTPTVILDGFGPLIDRMCHAGADEGARKLVDAVAAFPGDWHRLRCVFSACAEFDEAVAQLYGDRESPLRKAFAEFEVTPLAHDDAQYLAACLLTGEGVPCSDLLDVAEAVATASGENPYLIHNTIDWMVRFQPGVWTPERVRDVPTVLWNEPTDTDDTDAPEEPLERNSIDEELAKSAHLLEACATPAQRQQRNTTDKNPMLALPPAFVLLNASQEGASEEAGELQRDESVNRILRDWRRIQPLVQGKVFTATQPASFYVTIADPGSIGIDDFQPQSFVSLGASEAPVAGMRALAEARKALLELEETSPVLGIEPDNALFHRGAAQILRGQYDPALTIFQELARRTRNGACGELAAAALVNAAYAVARLHRYEEAAGVCDTLVRQFGEDTRPGVLACVAVALVNKSAALIAMGRGNDSIVVSRALLACSTPDSESIFAEAILSARFNLGYALQQLGHECESMSAYKAVVTACTGAQSGKLREMAADASCNMAVVHYRYARRAETIEACEIALGFQADHVRAHAIRIVAYLELHLIGEAIAAVSDMFRAFPPDSTHRAVVLSEMLREAATSPGLLQILVSACSDDMRSFGCAILLWLRRHMPLSRDHAVEFGIAEHTLRPIFEGDPEVIAALDVLRACRLTTLGDSSALHSLPADVRKILG
ncbi:MAG: hypothetical protein SGI88_16285 [Candidatus Hydrogenedentes bacterium]|nr:hypothetical protein [Candidatus Hydrogenedentota bacterium]